MVPSNSLKMKSAESPRQIATPVLEEGRVVRQRFGKSEPEPLAQQYDCLEHDPAFYSESGKAEKTDQGHLEVAVVFERAEKRQVVGPFRCRPVVPKFPQETACGASGQERQSPTPSACLPIAQDAWRAEPVIDRIEEEEPAHPQRQGSDGMAHDDW